MLTVEPRPGCLLHRLASSTSLHALSHARSSTSWSGQVRNCVAPYEQAQRPLPSRIRIDRQPPWTARKDPPVRSNANLVKANPPPSSPPFPISHSLPPSSSPSVPPPSVPPPSLPPALSLPLPLSRWAGWEGRA